MITLFSNGCRNCDFVEGLLNAKQIDFKKENDIEIMLQMGFTKMPMLDVDGEMMDFGQAVKYLMNIREDD